MTLYKHGVGYFERRGAVSGESLALTFHEEQMNDLLKSLIVIDRGEGQVLGIDYPTPQSREERLAGNSIRLRTEYSLRDLVASLRGRDVTLLLDQDERHKGRLVGLDEQPAEQPLATALVSLLVEGGAEVRAFPLGRVQGLVLHDETAAGDLRFFLDTSLAQADYREVTVRLSPGEHDVEVGYVAPAPTWRVSYRLVAESGQNGADPADVLLLGWGIFDNQLEEDLEEIQLSLVAGMPISFIYDLYTPFTPERPEVAEEERVAPGPVTFGPALEKAAFAESAPAPRAAMQAMRPAAAPAAFADMRAELRDAAPVTTTGEALGERFEYRIGTPVSVGRGQSAMVPIIAADLKGRRELLYNASQMPAHPVATLRLHNETGLTLERGPVTVVVGDGYAGEAILPYTAAGGELFVPYAVELNVRVREEQHHRSELRALHIEGAYLVIELWDIITRDYFLVNNASEEVTVLVEHPRHDRYEIFDSPEPVETTAEHARFMIDVPPRQEERLRVHQRHLISRREELQRQSFEQLSRYLRQGLLDKQRHDQLVALLQLWEQVGEVQKQLQELEKQRAKQYGTQEQIRQNLQALGTEGREGALRNDYVNRLQASEKGLETLAENEGQARELLARLEQEIAEKLAAL
jgi:hypothetical protein